VPEGCSPDTGG